jgi:hypothetical protein
MSFLPSEHSYRQALISLPSAAQLNPATVRKGSSGSTVRTLHAYLMPAIHSSLSGTMLGNEYSNKTFGASTEAYVKQFQKKSGLTADGIVGPNTWSALGLGKAQPAAPATSPGTAPATSPGTVPDADEAGTPFYKEPWFVPVAVSAGVLVIGTIFILRS